MSNRLENSLMRKRKINYATARAIVQMARSNLGFPKTAPVTAELEQECMRLCDEESSANANKPSLVSSLSPIAPELVTVRYEEKAVPKPLSNAAGTEPALVAMSISAAPERPMGPKSVEFSKGKFSSQYKLGNMLGDGAYSVVKKATHIATDKLFAVKIVEDSDDESALSTSSFSILDEIEFLSQLKHPNILSLSDIFYEDSKYYLVSELMLGGELFDRIVQKEFYSELDARDAAVSILRAIQYCHQNRIAHRDLKPENLLLKSKESDTDVMLADFGFAKKVTAPNSLTTKCGTPGYIAPEILNMSRSFADLDEGGYDVGVDMWSFGVILYVLLGGYSPFEDANPRALCRKIRNAEFEFHEEFWGPVSQDAKDLISALLTVNPNRRLTADQALQSRWMTASQSVLVGLNRTVSLSELIQFNAKRKLRAAVETIKATNKFRMLVFEDAEVSFGEHETL